MMKLTEGTVRSHTVAGAEEIARALPICTEEPMSEDRFLDRLREDAQPLRYEPADDFVWTRLSARIRQRIAEPTVIDLLARWFRPVAASLAAVAIVASVGLTLIDSNDSTAIESDQVEIAMAGDVYSVCE